MSEPIDTDAIRATLPTTDGPSTKRTRALCDALDEARALVAEYRAESKETWTVIRARAEKAERQVAAVRALCAEPKGTAWPGEPFAYVDEILAALDVAE